MLEVIDLNLNKKTKYNYDILGRIAGEKIISTGNNLTKAKLSIRYDDAKNRVAGYDVNVEGIGKSTDFVYGENNLAPDIITSVKQNGTQSIGYGYDSLNRLSTRTLNTTTPFETEYEYLDGTAPVRTTTFVESVINGSSTLSYDYDDLGNITSVYKNGEFIEGYDYDMNSVLRMSMKGSDVWVYNYDNGGNITSVTKNGTTVKSYTYGDAEWKDLLTGYNGETFVYDEIGNPITWRGEMTLDWLDGRRLSVIMKDYDHISYTYNADGLRNSKYVTGVTTDYYWLNGTLQAQKTGSEYIVFLHDENGVAYGFLLKNGATEEYYYYIFNVQGDVIGILDSSGTQVVEYTYNPWGEILSITGTMAETIGQKNP